MNTAAPDPSAATAIRPYDLGKARYDAFVANAPAPEEFPSWEAISNGERQAWMNDALSAPAAAVGGERCARCSDTRRVLVGPRSFGEVTSVPCPDCNLYRDDYISGAELESRLDTLAEEYEWDDGESRHVPTETERLLLVDFAHGILANELFVAMLKAHYDPNSRNRPAAPVGGFVVDAVVDLIIRDLCESDPAPLDDHAAIHIGIKDLRGILLQNLTPESSPAAQSSAKDGVRGEDDETINCEVAVAPASKFGVGVKLSTVIGAIRLRKDTEGTFAFTNKMRQTVEATTSAGLVDGEEMFYLQDTRQYVGNCVQWWGPDGSGYTTRLDEAGKYTKERALRQAASRDTDIAWPCAVIDKLARPTIDMQDLRREAAIGREVTK